MSALCTVPGAQLAGAAAAGHRPDRRTLLAICSSLCLYEAGMALNDWADRHTDAVERPDRPLPSGRIAPSAALGAATGLTLAGLALARTAGRPAFLNATALATTVWAYDLHLKNTPAGPAAMACARALDLLQGATTGRPSPRGASHPRHTPRGTSHPWHTPRAALLPALPSAALLGAHTYAVTTVSRRETQGSSSALPLTALAAITAITRTLTPHIATPRTTPLETTAIRPPTASTNPPSPNTPTTPIALRTSDTTLNPAHAAVCTTLSTAICATVYAATAGRPLFHAALNPSPYLLRRAVGGGIRATIPLQAALSARAGAPGRATALLALLPLARRLSRKVSPT
ncbi:SCO3242 family prenyltransferase [Streptomyces sp. MST-110588]|uniref:SCO3242 family prenyltransferase n=1 Tax=Streptomyces sp. MST-110588 TaxID=2833628 RepID=UPI003241C58A